MPTQAVLSFQTLEALLATRIHHAWSAQELLGDLSVSRATLNRHLAKAVSMDRLAVEGEGAARRYRLAGSGSGSPDTSVVTITCSAALADDIARALELYTRIGLGQFEELENMARMGLLSDRDGVVPDLAALELGGAHLKAAKLALMGFGSNASHGVCSPRIQPVFRRAWAAFRAIRHRLAWDRKPAGGLQVSFDEPLQAETLGGFEVTTQTTDDVLAGMPDNAFIGRWKGAWCVVAPSADGKHFDVLGESARLQTAASQAKNRLAGAPARAFEF